MICPNCGALHAISDNFCRHCGWNLNGAQLPMVIENKRSITPYQAEQALAIGGAATVVVGALAWLAKRWLAHKVASATESRLPQAIDKPRLPIFRPDQNQPRRAVRAESHVEDVQIESWVWIRRIIIRR